MPWNDNVKPGPWGAPPEGEDGKQPDAGGSEPSGAAGPRSPWGAPPPAGDAPGPRVTRPSTPGVGPRKRPDRPRPNPFGGGGSGGGGKGGDFDKLQREWADKARRFFRHPSGRGVRPGAVAVVAGAAVGLWALTGVYIVQPNEQGVVTRFGVYTRTESPGLKVRLPSPFENVQKVAVTTLNQLNVGGAGTADRPEESLMLTGDENIIDMDFTVTWRVSDADDYLFRVSNPDATVKAVAESAMREVVGRSQLNDVLSERPARVQVQAEQLMQRVLDSYSSGFRWLMSRSRGRAASRGHHRLPRGRRAGQEASRRSTRPTPIATAW
jgi:membrane protease subunit HflK